MTAGPIKHVQEFIEETERNAGNAEGDKKRIEHGIITCVFLFQSLRKEK